MTLRLERLRPWLCPELELWLLSPDSDDWHAVDPVALGMPYWAFAWPGGQALARYLLDHPEAVRGRRVLDFGSGGALEGIAAARAGAQVLCADVDPVANEWAQRNAALNGVTLETTADDLIGRPLDAEVVLVGDALYAPELAARVRPWLAQSGAEVLVGDPSRVEGALEGLALLARYDAPFDGDPRGLTLWPTSVCRLPRP